MAKTTNRYNNVHGALLSVTVVRKIWYWPYGERRTGSLGLHLGHGGAWGYYTDASTSRIYIRAWYLKPNWTRWLTVDPLWPAEPQYCDRLSSPVVWNDRSGLKVLKCWRSVIPGLGFQIISHWNFKTDKCNCPGYGKDGAYFDCEKHRDGEFDYDEDCFPQKQVGHYFADRALLP